MESKYSKTAQSAFNEQKKDIEGWVFGEDSRFVCPYQDCKTYALHEWGNLLKVTVNLHTHDYQRDAGQRPAISISKCSACGKESVFVGGRLVTPEESDAPAPAADLPDELVNDFNEARAILLRSPRGSAALLRLVVQKLLPHLGATKTDINAAIGELVASGKIKTPIQRALDTVRVIGNESVHPGTMDLQDDRETAIALFRIVNLIVETEITEPKRLEAIYASLPQSKLDGIAQRDMKK